MNDKKLDALLLLASGVLTEEKSNEFLEYTGKIVKIPSSLRRKIIALNNNESRKRELSQTEKIFRRVVAAILVFCTISFIALMSVEAVRETVWETIVTWYEDYIAIHFLQSKDAEKSVAETILTKKEPRLVLSEYTREVMLDSTTMFVVLYSNDDTEIEYTQCIIDQNELWFDERDTQIENIYDGELEATIIRLNEKQATYLLWSDGEYFYMLFCPIINECDELLIQMAKSVS